MHHHLDAYTYTNRLKPLPPQQKLIFALTTLAIALISHPITQSLIFIWLTIWTVGYARIPARVYGQVLAVMMLFLLTSLPALVIEVLSVHQQSGVPSHSLGGITIGNWYVFISYAGLMQAMGIAMRSLACISCLLFILFTIPFAELLLILHQCRIPAILIELLLLMYRFIFLFLDILTQLQQAQRSRGGYRTRKRWMHSAGLLAGQLLVRSLHRYHQFSLGLATRGFNDNLHVYTKPSHRCSIRYTIESIIGCMGLLILDFRL